LERLRRSIPRRPEAWSSGLGARSRTRVLTPEELGRGRPDRILRALAGQGHGATWDMNYGALPRNAPPVANAASPWDHQPSDHVAELERARVERFQAAPAFDNDIWDMLSRSWS